MLSDSDDAIGDDWERINLKKQDIDARRKDIQIALRARAEADRRRGGVIFPN